MTNHDTHEVSLEEFYQREGRKLVFGNSLDAITHAQSLGYSISRESLAKEAEIHDFYDAYEIAARLYELAGQPDQSILVLESGIYSWPLAVDGRVAAMALEGSRLAMELSQGSRALKYSNWLEASC
ncbi:hypothetical protein HYY74_00890 [Candidatus Woesearchaeota archaeon]|nr:hypothetical protein [Candidatus Woesearchaeota archaeon]